MSFTDGVSKGNNRWRWPAIVGAALVAIAAVGFAKIRWDQSVEKLRQELKTQQDIARDAKKSLAIVQTEVRARDNQLNKLEEELQETRALNNDLSIEIASLKNPHGWGRGELPPAAGNGEGSVYSVYFGTNQMPNDPKDSTKGFGHGRSKTVTYGRCEVWIPKTHRFGETGNPWYKRWTRLTFADDHVLYQTAIPLNQDDFWQAIQAEVGKSGDEESQCLVFLHGFNTDFEEAAVRAAQLGFDLRTSLQNHLLRARRRDIRAIMEMRIIASLVSVLCS